MYDKINEFQKPENDINIRQKVRWKILKIPRSEEGFTGFVNILLYPE